MLRTKDEHEVPPRFDDENNTKNNQEGDKSGAFGAPSLEDLMRRLEKLTAENKKLRAKAKAKRQKEALPQVKKTPHLKRKSPKRERKEEEITISLRTT
jgi:hypothetical protein